MANLFSDVKIKFDISLENYDETMEKLNVIKSKMEAISPLLSDIKTLMKELDKSEVIIKATPYFVVDNQLKPFPKTQPNPQN